MDNTIIQFDQVSKRIVGKDVLSAINFVIPKGQIVGIIGANGSGKSTVLKLMSGLMRPTSGRVLINGEEVERLSSLQIAFLPEQDVFYSDHTVEQTLHFYNKMYKDFDIEKALDLSATFQLNVKNTIAQLSKGNRARLKIVLVLARQVPLIVMDEPLSGLDPLVRESIIRSVISFLDMEKQTLVITTHEVREIEPLLDRVMLIKDGQIQGYDTVDQIQDKFGVGLIDWMRRHEQ